MAGNSIAKAIVSIAPKFENNALGALEKQLEMSGHSGGAKFAGALKKLAGAAVVVKAGEEIAEVFTQSFNSAARYEQLSGGMEKIFDQMDRSVILNDAKNAFKDFNMSMNDYLETINDVGASFSATMGDEKGYEVAKTGLQAIADYSSGTGKSMDVLKDKFGAITRSTSSYQSIADQFSGILPATSNDFLEQAQSAGILSDKYKKLTDVPVAEYQEAVAEMLKKGTEDLGLYGNTAEETEGTVSGALAGLSASWENLLTAMGTGEDIEGMANQLVDSFIVALGQIIPLAGQVIVGMGGALLTALGNVLVSGVNAIAEKYNEFEQAAIKLILGMAEGVVAKKDELIGKVRDAVMGMVNAVIAKKDEFVAKVRDMIQGGIDAVSGFLGSAAEAGKNIVQGIANGIADAASWVREKVESVCSSALDALKKFFGIASPSKVMRKMGNFVGEGLALGIEDASSDVDKSMDSMLDSAYSRASGFGIGLNASINGGKATNADVVRAIDALHNDLYAIIKQASPDGMTERQFARAVRAYA